ncbi:hypothetical protein EON68_03105 [archaeon]|nr:MAG: hypothetical protein EON68_03105 [archaeon]
MASLTSAPALDGGVGSRKMEADAEGNYRFSVGAGVQIWVELEDATAASAAPAAPATPSTLRVLEGDLEVAGVEAARGVSYTLRNNTPMYSHYGASVLLTGRFASVYVTTEHSQKLLLNLHARLEARREEAKRAGNAGPKVRACEQGDPARRRRSQRCVMLVRSPPGA